MAAATQHHQSRTMFTSAEDALLALGAEGRLTVTDVSTQSNEIGFARSGPLPLEVTAESGPIAALISRLPADLASSLREGLQRYVDAAPSREDTQPRISVQNAASRRPVERETSESAYFRDQVYKILDSCFNLDDAYMYNFLF